MEENKTVIEETEIFEEEIETMEKDSKWSLKKKLIVGGGLLTGLALGALALLGKKGKVEEVLNDFTRDDENTFEDIDDEVKEED